ncbi:DsrE family protein [Candidatus Acidulodesulfobacterium sp. H_13]|uniref:DsrE family protein n=1 Tax=Candidatus Acidulodesulfobacterium sp. H_13 TaxID=3395470 RepID=UPI003AF5ED95
MKYVIQFTNGTIMPGLLINVIKNISAIDETEEVNVVMFGPSVVSFLHHSKLKEQLKAVITNKVNVFVCRNAMNMFELKDGDIPDYARVVPAGVEKIAKLSKEGCTYIAL